MKATVVRCPGGEICRDPGSHHRGVHYIAFDPIAQELKLAAAREDVRRLIARREVLLAKTGKQDFSERVARRILDGLEGYEGP